MKNQTLGKWGEDYTCNKLVSTGYKLIERNYQTPFGEIDLIFQKGTNLYFIEVKTLHSHLFGLPREKVGRNKIKHICKSILYFMGRFNSKELNLHIMVAEVINKENELHLELIPVEVLK
ncbi:MAG: hypothetical protein DDT40_00143 [candidate division WS2 bacterium]|uniref:UPF0102 protein DDT42_00326 n=1 Tax=Psychracetigena formicireducens TaxID=2986056 RepID=A0A9E2BF70_PSYF1|nr:hypothetical protein [Candidatus Psychracetigena formicireducens]MBT9144485.1 hypothetical protein [Candidatus Psychracetigena formicireducens]MBT9149977.1 hypothetical protein [Candidatus Psychracetigena formicireducens]